MLEESAAFNEVKQVRKREGIALCLSGGGFRASLFHLGALRRLHELGVLQQVTAISSVSGGSIFSAFLADRMVRKGLINGISFQNWGQDVSEPIRKFTSHDVRTLPFFAHILWNWIWPIPRVRQLENIYRKHLTSLRLSQLPEHPRFIFCATNLTFGVNWEFTREDAGDFQTGYCKLAAESPLAHAVAASSCFPPIFGPLRVRENPANFEKGRYQGSNRDKIISRLVLSDGGVYDNMGLEPAWKEYEYVFVSDCGAPFDFRIGMTPWSRLMRYTSVVTKQTRAGSVDILRKR